MFDVFFPPKECELILSHSQYVIVDGVLYHVEVYKTPIPTGDQKDDF